MILSDKIYDIVVIGSGFFGSVIAEQASKNGYTVAVIEKRNHIGGNCFTEVDKDTGINVHKYGPHIFHTSNQIIWDYINQFTKFNNYKHKVRSKIKEKTYSLPINLDTINSFFQKNYSPTEAKDFLKSLVKNHSDPKNFEEQALSLVGADLYNAFIKGYTKKQWGQDPTELPASIVKRLPVRCNYDDNYYNDIWQGIPVDGYTPIFERMLDHKNIDIFLNTSWETIKQDLPTDQLVVYTGPIDAFYEYCYGELSWRTLDFKSETLDVDDYQGCCQINFSEEQIPYTRKIEHKHFHPEKKLVNNKTIITTEYSKASTKNDTPYYPVKSKNDLEIYNKYQTLIQQEKNTLFGGRLGEYMYYDMHQVIGSALSLYKNKIRDKIQKEIK